MNEAELKKCPFCGCEAEIGVNYGFHGYGSDIYYVSCKRCGCGAKIEKVSDNYEDLSMAVIEAWNRRVSEG